MSIANRERYVPRIFDEPWRHDLFDMVLGDRLRNLVAGERQSDPEVAPMRIEQYLDGDEIVVRAELPGVDPEKDVDVSIEDGVLWIKASREERTEEDKPDGYRSEFRYGSLVRGFRLADGTSEQDVRASYKDGILEVRVPSPSEPVVEEPRKVPVSRS